LIYNDLFAPRRGVKVGRLYTAEVLAAIDSLLRAGVSTTVTVTERPVERLNPSEVAQAARVASAWSAIPSWLRAELATFLKAAGTRLGLAPEFEGNAAVFRVYEMSSNIAHVERLAE
jgi:hypothetical protein